MEEEGGEESEVTPPPPTTRSIIQMAPPANAPHRRKPPPTSKTAATAKKKRRFHCAVENCEYSTPYSKDLARHMRKHTGEKPYSCDQCSKSYSRYDKLICHLRIHEGVRLYKCSECSYAGIDAAALKKHQRTHTNERPYKCQLCPYAAKAPTQLAVHLRSHTGDSPYFCTHGGCDAAFKTLSDLQRHNRLHTGEKPFACTEPGCSYRAAVKSNLNVHLRRHQNTKVPNQRAQIEQQQNDAVGSVAESDNADGSTRICPDSVDTLNGGTGGIGPESNDLESNWNGNTISPAVIPSYERIDSVKHTSNPPTKKSRILSAHISEETLVIPQPAVVLPFQYACKMCSYKADSLDAFETHMVSLHNGTVENAPTSVVVVPDTGPKKLEKKTPVNRTGRPRPSRRTKSCTKGSTEDLETYFDCPYCSASFVREDSLRCHLRQHSSSSPDNLTFNKRSIIHVAPTTSTVELTNIPSHVPLPFHQPLQVATTSVITQNPQSLTNSDFPPNSPHRQVYIVSPGGNSIHPLHPHLEETHYQIQE